MQPDFICTTPAPELPTALRSVVAAARRRAARAGDEEVDTGHLLHSLLESDPEALAAAAPLPHQAARLMGYLVQRSIGFGREWRGTAEQRTPGRGPADGRPERDPAAQPLCNAAAAAALERAAGPAGALPLLAALAADPDSRAVQILLAAGIDPIAVRARCAGARRGA
ncbi:Clp protease N-terminal domain-containing protein [Peterkaempfera sp. SMS 1(5)a]|uniref:Clp protease N-terminal domain-containing protein n=1 Tax=Peterkaempfera podocarpi TaxID=3232308 RepID=UPI00366CA180